MIRITDMLSDLSTNKDIFYQKKGAYTMLELFIVIIIVGLLFLVMQNLFINNNKIFIESATCTQKIYGEINKHLNYAASGKGIFLTGTEAYFPDNFYISVNPLNQEVMLGYEGNTTGIILNLSDNNSLPLCTNTLRNIILSGGEIRVDIKKHLQSSFNQPAITFQENGINTMKSEVIIPIYWCRNKDSGQECHEFHEIIINKGSQTIKQNRCIVFHETCEKREKDTIATP